MKERVQKIIAQAGLASRREADAWVRDGLVTINGKVAVLGDRAEAGKDAIKVSGKLLKTPTAEARKTQRAIYLFYKPSGVISMLAEDRSGRPTLREFFEHSKERLFPVGRLGFQQEGLLLLTNDGDLAQAMVKRKNLIRTFHVKTSDVPDATTLARLKRGARMDQMRISPLDAEVLQKFSRNALIAWTAQGPSNMDVKLFFEHRGVRVEKVTLFALAHRRGEGGKGPVAELISVEGLRPGQFRKLSADQVHQLQAIF